MPTPRNKELIAKSELNTFKNLFKAHLFFPTAFFQTFISSIDTRRLSFKKPIELQAINFRVPGAETSLDFIYFPSENININEEKIKSLLIIPGLTGSFKDTYIRELSNEALHNGFRPMILNNRWLTKPVKLPEIGPINFIEDLTKTVEYLVKTHKIKELYGIGISYGSNMLCKYLGTVDKKSNIFKGAVSIGNPFNMYRNKSTINKFWNLLLCKILQKALNERKESFKNTKKNSFNFVDVEEALKQNNFIQFDEYFTRRVLGYNSTDEYYKKSSCVNDLKNIAIPLLCLQSIDDPISHHTITPIHESQKNPNLFFYSTDKGGHIGWIEGVFSFSVFFPRPCIQFLKNIS